MKLSGENLIASLNEENISVKTRISYVKKYKNIDILKNLEEKDVDEIIKNLSSLLYYLEIEYIRVLPCSFQY